MTDETADVSDHVSPGGQDALVLVDDDDIGARLDEHCASRSACERFAHDLIRPGEIYACVNPHTPIRADRVVRTRSAGTNE